MTEVNFKFISDASAGDEFSVVSFSGSEAISRLYRYELEIKAPRSASINLDDVLNSPARFITDLDGEEFPVYGVLSSIDELQTVHGYVHYRVDLVPRLWWLSIYKTNEIYTIEKSVDQIIQLVLENAGFNSDIDFDLSGLNTGDLIQRDYRCQFGESDFDFISRLMENEGIFYYFDHSGDAEKIVFVNDMSYLKIVQPELIFDVSTQTRQLYDSINAWSCRKQRLPANVTVRDYNPDHPSLDISGTTAIDNMGTGTDYQYGENVGDENEAGIISEIRAEEHLCNKTRYYGESSVPRLQAGYLFNLDMHPNENYNGVEYLTLEVNHRGQNLDMSMSGESQQSSPSTPQYQNNFVAIEASEQYRPDRITPKPRFFGTMTAFVYAEAGNNLAEIDEFGRYRVHLPFDRADGTKESTDPDRKASTWIRKAQDYVGEGKGSYFPLTGGTEVLLTFINGDPDQPIIVGAMPNASEPSIMTTDNEFESITQTGSGNKIRMGDVEGEDRIVMQSPMANSWVRIGTMNDPITLKGSSPQFVEKGATYMDPMAFSTDSTDPNNPVISGDFGATNIHTVDTGTTGEYNLRYEDSNNTTNPDVAIRKVIVYDPADQIAVDSNIGDSHDGIRMQTAGSLWMESQSRYAEYIQGTPAIDSLPRKLSSQPQTDPNQLGDIRDYFGDKYRPTGMLHYKTKALQDSFQRDVLADANVKFSSFDTVNTQEGNVYDFGGYWVYNLGNAYVENHIDQQATLNTSALKSIGDIYKDKIWEGDPSRIADAVLGAAGLVSQITVFTTPAIATLAAAGAGSVSGSLVGLVNAGVMPLLAITSSTIGMIMRGWGTSLEEDWQIGDLVAGPDSGNIMTWAYKVGSSFEPNKKDPNDPSVVPKQTDNSLKWKYDAHYGYDGDPFFSSPDFKDMPMHTDTTWVEKKFGDSYNFTRGNTIDITHGHSEIHTKGDIYEFKYGGLREETHFSKGYLSHWAKSGHGVKTEINWDKLTHQIANFKYVYKGFATVQLSMPTKPTFKLAIAMSPLDANLSISSGTAINIKSAVSASFNVDVAVGLAINLKHKTGGEVVWNEVTGRLQYKGIGMRVSEEEKMKAAKQSLMIEKIATKLDMKDITLDEAKTKIEKSATGLKLGNWIFM